MGLFATTSSLSTKMIGTVFDTATVALASACIYDAENELKKHLCKRYDFTASPFLTTTSIPPVLTTLAETLAVGYMYENMARGSKDGYSRADRYIERVMDNVKQLLAGEAQLTDTSGNLVDEIDGDWKVYTTENYTPTFNEDDPKNWTPSQDKLDDIDSDRS
jgi:hypothetical protein